jgi:hypothetical protein
MNELRKWRDISNQAKYEFSQMEDIQRIYGLKKELHDMVSNS